MNDYTAQPTPEQTEEWRDIPGFENRYQASDLGRIRRVKAMGNNHLYPAFGILKPDEVKGGYLRVPLTFDTRPSTQRKYSVHRLVMLTFVGDPVGDRNEVNHKDGNPKNNCLSNLEYVTASENQIHSFRVLGRKTQKGELQNHAKLTESDIREIRELLKQGVKQRDIAKQFGIIQQNVSLIGQRKTWGHVE